MHDPRPVRLILVAQVVCLVLLTGWWGGLLTPTVRMARVVQIWQHEQVAQPPPAEMVAQGGWLWRHRWACGLRTSGVVGLAMGIGLAEGIAARQRDIQGGFRLSWWTVGVLVSASLPGWYAGYLLVPLSIPFVPFALAMAGLSGLAGWGLGLGRPAIA